MKTEKSPRARRYLAGLAAGTVAAAVLTSFALALIVAGATLLYAALRWSFLEDVRRLDLKARRRVLEEAIYADRLAHIEVDLSGTIPPGLRVLLQDTLPEGWSLAEGATQSEAGWGALPSLRYAARPPGRGTWRCASVEARARDPYGLFEARVELRAPAQLRVNASLESVRRGRAYAQKRPFEPRREDPLGLIFREFEFEGIRPFQIGDRLRDIDWKSTTRMQTLMSKVFAKEREGIVYCLVDASRTMRERSPGSPQSMLDHAAELVLQVGEMAAQRNFQLGLVAFDETGILVDVPASRSRGQERVLAQRVLGLPAALESGRRLDRGEAGARPLPAEEAFLQRARWLRGVTTHEAAVVFTGARRRAAAAESARRLVALHPPGSLFVFFFTDLATSPDDVVAAATLLRERQHKVAVGILPDAHYLAPPADPVSRDLEAAYRSERARSLGKVALRRMGAIVVELDPKATITRLTEEAAR